MGDAFESYDKGLYRRYTFPQELDKAIHMLEGIVKGVAIDGVVTSEEVTFLKGWCDCYKEAASRHPFNELVPMIEDALRDGVFDEEEQKDILWFCENATTENAYFNAATSDIQRLQGILLGISADGVITEEELNGLSCWIEEHDHMKATWPYDEIDSLVTSVLADGRIDESEHKLLLGFFQEFLNKTPFLLLEKDFDEDLIRHGVCAACPEILFAGKLFCFTGRSEKSSRKELAELVRRLGGGAIPRVNKDVNYLVIGGEGNKSWAFSCYGRKVEQAIDLRKRGRTIQIVHEFDFWDAVEDMG